MVAHLAFAASRSAFNCADCAGVRGFISMLLMRLVSSARAAVIPNTNATAESAINSRFMINSSVMGPRPSSIPPITGSGGCAGAQRLDFDITVSCSYPLSFFLAKILLGVQGQLQQTLQKLIRGNADEILEHELLGEQATDVTELEHLATCRIDEIAMAVVDHDEIALCIKP